VSSAAVAALKIRKASAEDVEDDTVLAEGALAMIAFGGDREALPKGDLGSSLTISQ
jgi:hypothetical protein